MMYSSDLLQPAWAAKWMACLPSWSLAVKEAYKTTNEKKNIVNNWVNYHVTNSTGATQHFSANHKTSTEQKNRSLFISDQSQMRVKSDWNWRNSDSFVQHSSCDWKKNVAGGPGWARYTVITTIATTTLLMTNTFTNSLKRIYIALYTNTLSKKNIYISWLWQKCEPAGGLS